MPSVDERVVRMEFDNAAFERKMGTTLASLDKLNKALKFEGAGKGLADVSAHMGRFDASTISEGIEGISKKFLALSTIAITALANIASKAMQVGAQMIKSLSLDQVIGGFKEYELKMGSIQTIMAGSGESLDVVNKKLQELNEYSDKTIYSFADMTTNIGKFTNAGVSLDMAVSSIQGVANVAAVSGANAEEASRAMYNFAQALSKGHVQLIDWKSIELANMGTVEFKQQLLDAAVAAGTLTKQGEEYITMQGNAVTSTKGFNESLTDQWLTTEVLTGTLGDYADETTDIGKKAMAAAQDIKTFSQLMATTKESIGSGWAQTFELLIGNFEDAKKLFGMINKAIGGFVQKNADARNAILETWVKLGGRMVLIEALQVGLKNLGKLLKPIKDAFRAIFPPMTGEKLMALTVTFNRLMKAMEPSKALINGIKNVFTILFSVLKVGWTVIKEGVKFIGSLIGILTTSGTGKVGDFLGNIAGFIKDLAKSLTDGGAIREFFENLLGIVSQIPGYLKDVKDNFFGLFDGIDTKAADTVDKSLGRVEDRFKSIRDTFRNLEIPDPLKDIYDKVTETLTSVWEAISSFFSDLGKKIGDAITSGDFDPVYDALNTVLLGGVVGLLAKFLKSGIKIDIGGGFLDKIKDTLGGLTGVLEGMQTKLKAQALMQIAGAIAVLTASVLVLSLIDSAALSKALAAMAVGFGQLMAAFAILSKLSLGPTSAISFGLLAGGMTLLAGAILILAFATKQLAELDWGELSRGLTGITALLLILIAAAIPLSAMSGTMIRAGAGLIVISTGLLILAAAVKIFSLMSLTEIGQGMAAIAVGLGAIGLAMKLMPKGPSIVLQGIALLAIATSLNILAGAVKIFATFSWGEMAKGLVGIAGALVVIGLAMQLMPNNLILTGAGLLLVSVALGAIAAALKIMGGMSWAEIARGIVAMAGSLIVLAVAAHAMSGALVGAIAIGIMAGALLALALVLKAFASISWGDLLHGILGIGIALAALALAALAMQPALPAMLLLGVALMAIGAGFALLGFGAAQVAKAFYVMAKVGKKGSQAFVDALKNMGKAIPAFVTGLAEGMLELIKMIGEFAPELAKTLGKVLSALVDELIKLVPKLGELISTLITTLFDLLRDKIPEYAMLGVDILIALLQGIRDRIDDVVIVVGEIITRFIDALAEEVPNIIESVVNLFVEIYTGVAAALGEVAATLLFGVGIAFIGGFISGLGNALPGVTRFFMPLATKIVGWIGNVLRTLWSKGTDLIGGLLRGIGEKANELKSWFGSIGSKILGWVGNLLTTLKDKGYQLISGFFSGIGDRWNGVLNFFRDLGTKIKNALPNPFEILKNVGRDIVQGLLNGLKGAWHFVTDWLSEKAGGLLDIAKKAVGAASPSKAFMTLGVDIVDGLQIGLEDQWASTARWMENLDIADHVDTDAMAANFQKVLASATASINDMDDMNPVITPVLDLSQIAADAGNISNYIETAAKITPAYSMQQARNIAVGTQAREFDREIAPGVPGEVRFEQNIYAPRQLSTADIYRQTRNQITMAKEELSIP